MSLFTSLAGFQWARQAAAADQRVEEDALYAVGEQFNNLNACALASRSCVSTQNDDEKHFVPPWQYDGPQAAAVAKLVAITTGAPAGHALHSCMTCMPPSQSYMSATLSVPPMSSGTQPASSILEDAAADVPRLSTARAGSPALQAAGAHSTCSLAMASHHA